MVVEQDDPGAFGKRVEDRLEPVQLRTADNPDRVREGEMTASIRIEEDESAARGLRGRDGQRENVVPHSGHLPSAAPRAPFGETAQQRGPIAVLQVVPERGPESPGRTVHDVNTLALDGIER